MERTERLRNDALVAAGDAAEQLDVAEANLEATVARALHWGASWAQIGDTLGVTRQSAHRRFRHLHWNPATQTAWTEPPLPI